MKLEQSMRLYGGSIPEVSCFIKKEGNQHCVKSHSGKNLGCYQSASGAKKRLKQVEYFKHKKGVQADTFYGPNSDMGPAKALEML